jgi:hypothetical protein
MPPVVSRRVSPDRQQRSGERCLIAGVGRIGVVRTEASLYIVIEDSQPILSSVDEDYHNSAGRRYLPGSFERKKD